MWNLRIFPSVILMDTTTTGSHLLLKSGTFESVQRASGVEPMAKQEALWQTIVWEQENLTATSTEQLNDYLAEDKAMECVIDIQSHQPVPQLPAPPQCSETHRVENHPGQ